jgi:hypothetical protein
MRLAPGLEVAQNLGITVKGQNGLSRRFHPLLHHESILMLLSLQLRLLGHHLGMLRALWLAGLTWLGLCALRSLLRTGLSWLIWLLSLR